MFHLAWLKLLQLVGIAPKTHLMTRSGMFNPFGHYSATGVKRGSRWVWFRWILLGTMFGLLFFACLQQGMPELEIICAVFEFIGFSIGASSYQEWAQPACTECGERGRVLHSPDCSYDAWFRHGEKHGMWEL